MNGGMDMANLSELDLQNLRHLIGGYETFPFKKKEKASRGEGTKEKKFFVPVSYTKLQLPPRGIRVRPVGARSI